VRALLSWDLRAAQLQKADAWQLEGRAALAAGTQGWQASLSWQQAREMSDVHLAGPLGVGALEVRLTPEGLTLNGEPPGEAVLARLRERIGYDLPLENLRYWLLGVPDPTSAFELSRNAEDRAAHLTQADWTVDYERYMAVGGDVLPARLVLNHAGVRLRIAVDRWEWGS